LFNNVEKLQGFLVGFDEIKRSSLQIFTKVTGLASLGSYL